MISVEKLRDIFNDEEIGIINRALLLHKFRLEDELKEFTSRDARLVIKKKLDTVVQLIIKLNSSL